MSESNEVHVVFKTDAKIGGVCDPDSGRYDLRFGVVSPRKYQGDGDTGGDIGVWLTATDGRCLAVKPADGIADGHYYVPDDVFPRRKGETWAELNGDWTIAEKKKRLVYSAVKPADARNRYPRIQDVLFSVTESDYHAVTIDAKLLLALAQAVSDGQSEKITLFIAKDDPTDKPIGVLGSGGENPGIGVIMPMGTSDVAMGKYEDLRIDYCREFDRDELAKRYDAVGSDDE